MAGSFIASSFMEKYAMKSLNDWVIDSISRYLLVVMPLRSVLAFLCSVFCLRVGFGITITTTTVTAQSTVEPEKWGCNIV